MDPRKLIGTWVLTVLLAATFAMAGFAKLSGVEQMVHEFHRFGYPDWFRLLIGAGEMFSAVFLFVPRAARLGAGLLIVIMLGAISTHLRFEEYSAALAPVILGVMLAVLFVLRQPANAIKKLPTTDVYKLTAKLLDGKEIDLAQYKGEVLLVVNTASQCGFTGQYQGLEKLHKQFADKGLRVVGFPCNQFGKQEHGDSSEIGAFCQKNYGVGFQMFEKIDVNGNNAHPLYKYLTSAAPGIFGTKNIKWNFTKFLVGRDGKVFKRYAPNLEPKDLVGDIEALLKA
ncbi:MAG: DoxX family protein [Candidatus Obscuribacterales bacterium]|jgi:glutathione peroxidase|nr:DoxX family protein [Candidatus Obscuribacterales bacterium]